MISPNSISKVAIVGTGFIATQKHLPAWQRNHRTARVVALCDLDVQRGKQIARQFGVPHVYESLPDLLEAEQPDLVDICTPPQTHAKVAVTALRAGAHVLIEKPMAVSREECDAIIAASKRAGRQVCVAHSDLFYPAFLKAREWVRQGLIGEFKGMRIFLSTPADYITSKPAHWAHRLPGGVIGETGPHVVYLALALMNTIHDVRIYAQKLLPEFPWSPFEDYRLELIGENAICSVTLTYATQHWAAQVEVWGTEGMLKVDLESQSLVHYRRSGLTRGAIALSALSEAAQIVGSLLKIGAKVLTRRFEDTHGLLIRKYLESLSSGGDPPVTPEEGREAVRVMNLIVEQLHETAV